MICFIQKIGRERVFSNLNQIEEIFSCIWISRISFTKYSHKGWLYYASKKLINSWHKMLLSFSWLHSINMNYKPVSGNPTSIGWTVQCVHEAQPAESWTGEHPRLAPCLSMRAPPSTVPPWKSNSPVQPYAENIQEMQFSHSFTSSQGTEKRKQKYSYLLFQRKQLSFFFSKSFLQIMELFKMLCSLSLWVITLPPAHINSRKQTYYSSSLVHETNTKCMTGTWKLRVPCSVP